VDAPTHLVWYGVTGTDPNMDIIGAVALVIDSSGTASGTTTQYFTAPLGSVSIAGGPALYAVGPPRAMQYGAQLVDAQGNTSNTDSAGIDQPDAASAPFIFYASNTVSAGSIDVYAQWSAGAAPMKAVDFVVRTYTGVGVDTVFMVCTLAVPDQGGIVSGTCPRTGSGITCDLGESCGGSVVVPQRVRRR
jgi:hypothetical protein